LCYSSGVFPVLLILLLQLSDDLARGEKLFQSQCALCHGQTGLGGRGPNLALPVLRRAADDQALLKLIRDGVPGSEMGGAWQMTDREISQVAAYVRQLGEVPQEALPGDAGHGRAIYAAQGCATCHIVAGAGAGYGPELTDVGAKRSARHLREHLADPGKSVADGFMMTQAVTRDGRRVKGIRINEDSFTVQIQDAAGTFYSFRKRDLTEYKKLPGESPMPSYRLLSAAELDDLTAYLASLRGAP
jgi:cytochrome c oxidase cbb3-type subunit 3